MRYGVQNVKNFELIDNTAKITYTVQEKSNKQDPFYLQNIMYDLPFDTKKLNSLKLSIVIPAKTSSYIIDDLHFVSTKVNHVEIILHEKSFVNYRLFVANHQLCQTCEKKEFYYCQKLPAKFVKSIKIILQEKNAQAYVNCHYLGDKDSSLQLKTSQHHRASETASKLVVKGVLDDSATLISDNTIIVDKCLEKIIAEQENKNLMLSDKSHIISVPKLQINSQDVSCKHGASISTISQEELFYLQSRGVDKDRAEKILVTAFLS
jgi:Fe-S cluster assembly scaffold protein SufB